MTIKTLCIFILSGLAISCLSVAVVAQQPNVRDHAAALKKSLEQNKQQLMKYQWTETVVVSVKGEEKSTKQYTARYGPDGKVQKTLMEASPEKTKPGLRGHIIEKKREELSDYMKRAADLVKDYIPPEPKMIQSAVAAGKASVDIIEPGKRVRVVFRDYLKPGDELAIEMEPSTNRILSGLVNSYLDDPKDTVRMNAQFDVLPDGTNHASMVTLNADAKNLTVQTTNSDYRPIGG